MSEPSFSAVLLLQHVLLKNNPSSKPYCMMMERCRGEKWSHSYARIWIMAT